MPEISEDIIDTKCLFDAGLTRSSDYFQARVSYKKLRIVTREIRKKLGMAPADVERAYVELKPNSDKQKSFAAAVAKSGYSVTECHTGLTQVKLHGTVWKPVGLVAQISYELGLIPAGSQILLVSTNFLLSPILDEVATRSRLVVAFLDRFKDPRWEELARYFPDKMAGIEFATIPEDIFGKDPEEGDDWLPA